MSVARSESVYVGLRRVVAFAALHAPVSAVCRRFGVTRAFVRYWLHRFLDPAWHQGSLGGARRSKFTVAELHMIWALLYLELRADPLRTAVQLAQELVGPCRGLSHEAEPTHSPFCSLCADTNRFQCQCSMGAANTASMGIHT